MQRKVDQHYRADVALILVTVIWGSTFVLVKHTLDSVSPFVLISSRFWTASIALFCAYLIKSSHKGDKYVVRDGIFSGIALAGGFMTQTLGLTTTEAAKTAFITGLNVVIVPVLAVFVLRKNPAKGAVLGVLLATTGLGIMTLDRSLVFSPGDLWVLACAFFFALHIIITGQLTHRHDVLTYTMVQMVTVAVISLVIALMIERKTLTIPASAMSSILYLGVGATGLVFGLQTWAQRHTAPTHTALIFILEPVFAAVFAAVFANEQLVAKEWLGGAIILLGMLVSEVGSIIQLQAPLDKLQIKL